MRPLCANVALRQVFVHDAAGLLRVRLYNVRILCLVCKERRVAWAVAKKEKQLCVAAAAKRPSTNQANLYFYRYFWKLPVFIFIYGALQKKAMQTHPPPMAGGKKKSQARHAWVGFCEYCTRGTGVLWEPLAYCVPGGWAK